MRYLIFSDNHSRFDLLDDVIEKIKPDIIYGLGDYDSDESELKRRNIVGVRGNSYIDPDLPTTLSFNLEGFNICLTHGHKYDCRNGYTLLEALAVTKKADIVFFGHTHNSIIYELNKRLYVNPGSITIPSNTDNGTFVLMEIIENTLNIKIIDAINFDILDETEIYK